MPNCLASSRFTPFSCITAMAAVIIGKPENHDRPFPALPQKGIHEHHLNVGIQNGFQDTGQLTGPVLDFSGHHIVHHGRDMHLHEQLTGLGHIGNQQSQLAEGTGVHQVQGSED